jgi:hypothetical protein
MSQPTAHLLALADFNDARLDEDEATAKAADGDEIEATPSLWGTKYLTLRGDHDDRHTAELPADLADHIARHDPARVLAFSASTRRPTLRSGSSWPSHGTDSIR